jgi:stage II sporulation protein P
MQFKTVIITRKKIIFTLICIAALLFIGGMLFFLRTSGKTVDVFKDNSISYEDILAEGLPIENEKKFDLKNVINKIIGFDFDEPETIVENYSTAFDGSDNEEEYYEPEPAETDLDETETSDEAAPIEENPTEEQSDFPTKEQICTSVGLSLSNATNYDVDIDSMCADEMPISIDDDGPQVLVVHTHTTECYDGDEMSGETERTTDSAYNVIEVGNVICDTLESYGIKTYHDTTYHDYPSYQGAYTRTLGTISSRLEEYPSIKMVLDIHRDAFVYSDGSKLTVTSDQNGIRTAQVMLVCGTDSMGLEHENWRENLKLAAKIQNAAEIMYPGLMRPLDLRTERFNMHMTKGSILIEVGSNGNTLDEAKEGGKDIAKAIAAVLKNP